MAANGKPQLATKNKQILFIRLSINKNIYSVPRNAILYKHNKKIRSEFNQAYRILPY
jgi:hypothetical protein